LMIFGAATIDNWAGAADRVGARRRPAATDHFNQADGPLGVGWSAMSNLGLSIASRHVVGTARATAGDIRVAEYYGSDQSSQIQVTSTQLRGGQWIGPTVRSQNGGQNTYLGIYFWNNGDPQLRVYKRRAGTWTQLGDSYSSGPLAAGTQLTLSAAGSQISFRENGTVRIKVTDRTLTAGAPGLMTYGAATADNWAGGSPPIISGFSVLPHRFRAIHAATLRLTLSGAATLTVAIRQLRAGHVVGDRCSLRAHRGTTCRLRVTLMRLRFHARSGLKAMKLPLRRLAPGHYMARIYATGRDGLRSRTVRPEFTILRALPSASTAPWLHLPVWRTSVRG
jgi:hypothetical protein